MAPHGCLGPVLLHRVSEWLRPDDDAGVGGRGVVTAAYSP